jgi:hypothetical protein
MGDWGSASPHQKQVAKELGDYVAAQKAPFQAMLLEGDNFYVPLASTDDPQWKTIFEDMYDAKRLPMPFFAVLGNHDYKGDNAQIELDYTTRHPESRWRLPARWYRINLPAESPLAVVLMLDSDRDQISLNDWEGQKKWIDQQLASVSPGTWTMCCAHHPLFSNGAHGDTGPLKVEWGPIFKQHHLDFFICGHDHDLQHLEIPGEPESFLLVGGGGQNTRNMLRDQRGPFSRSLYGFAHLELTPERAIVKYIDPQGQIVHAFERTKAGEVKMISSTPSDKATNKPLKTVQGLDQKKAAD